MSAQQQKPDAIHAQDVLKRVVSGDDALGSAIADYFAIYRRSVDLIEESERCLTRDTPNADLTFMHSPETCRECIDYTSQIAAKRNRIAILRMLKTAFEGIKSSLESARTHLENEASAITGQLFDSTGMTEEERRELQQRARQIHEQRGIIDANLEGIEEALEDIEDALDATSNELEELERAFQECVEERC